MNKRMRVITMMVMLLILVAVTRAEAEDGDFVWAKSMGGPYAVSVATAITVDASGNIYTTGGFSGTVDFDPGPGTFNLTAAGNRDIFLSKLDSAGNFLWVSNMGGSNSCSGYGIAVDGSGNVYITGSFEGTVDFDPGPGTFILTSPGTYISDIFVLKLNSAGNFVWAGSMMGSDSGARGYSIAVDSARNVYTTGYFGGTVDFDPGTGTFNLTAAGNRDIFLSKLDSNGDFVWARSMGDTGEDTGMGITVDNTGNVYTTGPFEATVDFDPGTGVFNVTQTHPIMPDTFVLKLDSGGNFVWARSMMGEYNLFGDYNKNAVHSNLCDIKVDDAGNVYIADMGFVSKLDSSGELVWFKYVMGTERIVLDAANNAYTTGATGSGNSFVSKLDSAGNLVWTWDMDGEVWISSRAIAVDSENNVYMAGYFAGSGDFDPGPGTYNLTAVGQSWDIFVLKLSGPEESPVEGEGESIEGEPVEGESPVEGEGEAVEGEGETPVEGEGETPVEGEGEPPVEGEVPVEGEPVEGEGEQSEGEGEVDPCNPDITPPEVTLSGEIEVVLENCVPYEEEGFASVIDACDGDIGGSLLLEDVWVSIWVAAEEVYVNSTLAAVEDEFNTNYAGISGAYTFVYSVVDAANNEGIAERTVSVICEPVEGEGEVPEGEGEPMEGEGEPLVEGESVEGEGELPVEGEGEVPIEGEGEPDEGECAAPSVITNVTASSGLINIVNVTWDAVDTADSYNVYRDWSLIGVGIEATVYTDYSTIPSQSYRYSVAGVNECGMGVLSAIVRGYSLSDEGEGELIEGEGELVEGESVTGEGEGESAEGELPEGEPVEGEIPEGEVIEGEGELIEGEPVEGEVAEGEYVESKPEGEITEGEMPGGEGETDTLEEIANDLEDNFDMMDSNSDDRLSIEEILTRFPEFNASDFVALDLDGDGFLSLIELQGNSSEEECKCGCGRFCCRTELTPVDTVKRRLGDWLLIGLSLLMLAAFASNRNV